MKKNLSSTEKKSKVLMMISFIFTVLLFTSCSKEDVTPNSDAAQNPTAQGGAGGGNLIAVKTTPVQNTQQIPPIVPEDAMIYISHGECLGKCPAYSVMVKHDGTVVYNGIRFVGTMGTVEFAVKRDLVIRLRDRMIQSGFLRLPDSFPFIGDAPRTVTALRMDLELPGHNLKVVVDYGIQVPEELVALRHMIEAELGIDRLVNGSGEQAKMTNN